jgi:predicted ATPase/DNA-binding CsgD family transcriptional regulator
MTNHSERSIQPPSEALTRREREILALLAQGLTGPEIAARLTVATSSVKSHLQHIYGKLSVNSKRQAVSRAQALGLLEPAPGAPKPAAGQVAAGPAERAASGPPNNLPIHLTHFIGRDKALAELKRQLIGDVRLLTLTRPGGTGKTRLALQSAAASLTFFPDGVWLVELASIAQASLVTPTVTEALGLRELNGRQPKQALAEWLRGQQLLLVLDNCEHLVTACSELAEHLLQVAPRLTILATSREPLGLPGETTYPVPSLSLPDRRETSPLPEKLLASEAVRLFVERAAAARPDFVLTDANAPSVAQICLRLDGIPLALELAAARVRVLSVEQIAERLNDRFRLLAGGSRTAPPRQQTLSGAIDWSYDLLSEPERALLRRLSVFAGGWILEAAEQVGEGLGDVLDLLAQLVAKSLVLSEQQLGKAARFRMLETIREYARDKLARAGEAQAARSRHLSFYVAFAEKARLELRHHRQVEWLSRLDTEADNLRTAFTWALDQEDAEAALGMSGALWEYAFCHERENMETFQRLSAALRLPANQGALERSACRARALMGAGRLGLHTDLATRRSWLEESLSIYRELGDRAGTAEVLMHLALEIDLSPQKAAEAIPFLEEALGIWVEVGDPWGIGTCLQHTAFAANVLGNRSKAMDDTQRSVPLLREAGDQVAVMGALNGLAWYTWLNGETAARELFEDHLNISKDLGDKGGMREALQNLFEISIAQGHYDQARAEALALRKSTGRPREPASAQVRLGQIDYWQGHLAEARAHFEAALESFQQLNDRNGLFWAPSWLGCVAYRAGDLQQAQALLEASLAGLAGAELFFALLSRGDVARAQGDLAYAADVYARGLKLALDQGGQPPLAEYLEGFAKLALADERPTRATRLLGAAKALRTRIGTPVPLVEQADYDLALAQARAQLGSAAFEAAWAEGRALDWTPATAYALET